MNNDMSFESFLTEWDKNYKADFASKTNSSLQYNFLESNYFESGTKISQTRLDEIEKQTKNLPKSEIFGKFYDQDHYLESVNLLLKASLEAEHSYEVIDKEIVPRMLQKGHLLDIGVGNGELSYFVGKHFNKITAVDTSDLSLSNLPSNHWNSGTPIIKLTSPIQDLDLADNKYDLILLSHVLYYIPLDIRSKLINYLYNHLSPEGILVMIYNDGGDRYDLTQNFNGSTFSFKDVEDYLVNNFKNLQFFNSYESMHTKTLDSILHVAGVCLNDANTTANKQELVDYLNRNHLYDDGYYINMIHKVILLGKESEGEF